MIFGSLMILKNLMVSVASNTFITVLSENNYVGPKIFVVVSIFAFFLKENTLKQSGCGNQNSYSDFDDSIQKFCLEPCWSLTIFLCGYTL